jgi:glycosyltransferase 2 family protein
MDDHAHPNARLDPSGMSLTAAATDRSAPKRKRGTWHIVLGVVVSLVCLWLAAGKMVSDPAARVELGRAITQADYRTLPVMWLGLAVFYILKAWRWQLLLVPIGHFRPVKDLLPPTMIGFAFNNLLPAHLGDLVRVFLFARQRQLNKTAVLSSVVLERVFDVVAILLYLGVGLALVPGMSPAVRQSAWVFAGACAAAVLGGLAYVIWTRWFVNLLEVTLASIPLIPPAITRKLAGMLESGAAGLSALKSPRLLSMILLLSLAQWLLNGILIHLSLMAFGIHVSPLVSGIVLGVVAIGVTVPSSPGYFGVIQLCFMTVLELFTENSAAVFSASVYFHLSQYIPVTLVGLYYFSTTGLKMEELEQKLESEPLTDGASPLVGS